MNIILLYMPNSLDKLEFTLLTVGDGFPVPRAFTYAIRIH